MRTMLRSAIPVANCLSARFSYKELEHPIAADGKFPLAVFEQYEDGMSPDDYDYQDE